MALGDVRHPVARYRLRHALAQRLLRHIHQPLRARVTTADRHRPRRVPDETVVAPPPHPG